jgi:tRNA A37 threonylcarbamoyladenosine synthetase subunit TsaC/SUA5/YrdC
VKLRGDRRTIGVRVPGCAVTLEIVRALGRPLVNTSAMVSADEASSDPAVIASRLGGGIDLVLDAGARENLPSTVIDLCGEQPEVLRLGRGDPDRCGAV